MSMWVADMLKIALILIVVLLAACSDTSVSDDTNGNNMPVYSTVEDLPPCTEANEGEQLFVKSEGIIRVCADEKWFATISQAANCSTEELPDQSGVKIICNGDSVGVVLNGKNGTNGRNGSNGKVINVGSDTSVTVLDSEKVATSLEGVNGFSQKGPFLNGSKVTVLELESGRTLYQTGYTFKSEIKNDSGHFSLNARTMVSQYVELHAEGYYRNEVKGGNSEAPLTLYALTDVSKRDGGLVNINLLTHLEYHRVIYLVKEKKMKVFAAKAQAEEEIFNLLGIKSKGFSSSEDLDITGTSEGDAALLAFSVMLQGDRTVAQLTELLANISEDMETDGTWDDSTTKAKIADWTANAILTGKLDTIRKNVEDWKLSTVVPNFEKYIRSFWIKEYGLPTCDKDNVDTLVAAGAKRLANSTDRYICVDSIGIGYMWRMADSLEKDTYGWAVGTDGQIKNGDINTAVRYVYDSSLEKWRKMTDLEEIYGFCNEGVETDAAASVKPNKFDKIGDEYYPYVVCRNRHWEGCSAYYADTRNYPSEAPDGTVRRGDYTTNTYVFDQNFGFWRVGWREEGELGQGCTASKYGQVVHFIPDYTDADFYYSCRPDSFLVDYGFFKGYEYYKPEQNVNGLASDDEHWVQTQFRWHEDDYEVGVNTYPDPCDENGKMVPGKKNTGSLFVCDAGFWRAATPKEELYNKACTSISPLFVYNDMYACDSGSWRNAQVFDFTPDEVREKFFKNEDPTISGISFGTLHDDRDGRDYRTVTFSTSICGTQYYHLKVDMEWMAENLNFAGGEDYPNLDGHNVCYKGDSLNCLKGGRYYTWSAAMNIADKWNNGSASSLIQEQHQGVCPDGWHIPSSDEWNSLAKLVHAVANNCPMETGMSYFGGYFILSSQPEFPDAQNTTGFNGLHVGFFENSNFDMSSGVVMWWSSTEHETDEIFAVNAYAGDPFFHASNAEKKQIGLPVRCVKNYQTTGN